MHRLHHKLQNNKSVVFTNKYKSPTTSTLLPLTPFRTIHYKTNLTRMNMTLTTQEQHQQIAFRTQQLVFSPFNISNKSKRTRSFSTNSIDCQMSTTSASQEPTDTIRVSTSAAYLPKYPNQNRKKSGMIDCGEDAYFITSNFDQTNKNSRVVCMGVSDGVGGYSEMIVNGKRVDPSEMAWALMNCSQKYLEQSEKISPKEALVRAYDDIIDNKLVAVGGATACLVAMHKGLDEEGTPVLKLTSANLGDSAFYVIRDGKIIYRSQDQTHYFNCPFQLSAPKQVQSNVLQDNPRQADELEVPIDLYKGDVVIVATDGLTDNVFDQDVARIVQQRQAATTEEEDVATLIAHDLLKEAVIKSRSQTAVTPFQKYSQSHGINFPGGKVDDISLCVGVLI